MLAAVAIYGTNFAITRHATQNGLTPGDVAALRFGVAGLLLLPVFLRRGLMDCAGIGWARGLALAAMSGIPMVLLMNRGLALAPAAHGASIQPGTVTVIGAVGSAILFRVMPPRVSLAGLAVVLAGLACIGVAGTTSGSPQVVLGDLHFLAAGALWGLYPLMLQRWAVPPMTGTAVVAVLSLAYLPAHLLVAGTGMLAVDPWFLVFHGVNQGVFNVILGLWLWGSAVQALGAATAQRFPPLIPVAGTLAAVPILGEWPGLLQSLGVALIVSGLLVASFGARIAWRPGRRAGEAAS
jgi:drug/metabolite transporter (DMT)-like permease